MNSFFEYSVVERIKFSSFNNEKNITVKQDISNFNVTNKKYKNKINNVKNEKIKKSLLELTRVFREK